MHTYVYTFVHIICLPHQPTFALTFAADRADQTGITAPSHTLAAAALRSCDLYDDVVLIHSRLAALGVTQ